ncbi:hypothetical protein AN639_05025 [Candidatus Epulonipiscium fishelsonii]|uniref:Uncharacterized protein n=1 Tax=Candidatus Epulonipiscium fishelsonii TaxID=77094 RepID=A0ACC8XFA0_9FIRM|nr:hypothetical protein AN639_05025 [Epulopiscium sp. SCG-B05WGA-EpuloA1]ONI41960.1 hypothetical protein AN396_02495 [Epulopiscium sp. SCG-B11WGA-EpuloA1]
MAINKFRKRLALMVATISAVSPMSTFASTPVTPPSEITHTYGDKTDFGNLDDTAYTTNFQLLEDAILDAINLIEGTTSSAYAGTDLDGTHSTSHVYYWATAKDKEAYDTAVKHLLDVIEDAQDVLTALSSNYADLDTTLNKTHNSSSSIAVTTPGLLHGEEVYKNLGTTQAYFDVNIQELVDSINDAKSAMQGKRYDQIQRTTGSYVEYKAAKDVLGKAITSAQALLATTTTPLTTDAGLTLNITTGKPIILSALDGADVTSGTAWVSETKYKELKEVVKEAQELLANVYDKIDVTTQQATTQVELEEMADKLFGRDTTTPSNLAATPTTGSLYSAYLSSAKTAPEDGAIVKARKQMEYLLIDAQANIYKYTTTDSLIKTTADNIEIADKAEDNDGDNTYDLKDPRNEDIIIIYKDNSTDEYVTTGTGVTTATVTYVHEDTDGHEGSNVVGSWVKTADWDTFETAITDAIEDYIELDGTTTAANIYADADFTTGAAIAYTDDDYEDETNSDTATEVNKIFNTLQKALYTFTGKARNDGELGDIIEEKGKFLETIDEAHKTKGYVPDTNNYTTDTSVNLVTSTFYKVDEHNKVESTTKNGTDIPAANSWVTKDVWDTFETAIGTAVTTYNQIIVNGTTNNALSLEEIEEVIGTLEDAIRVFDRAIEGEGLKEEYEAAMGNTNNNKGLIGAIATARSDVGSNASVDDDGELTTDTSATVLPSKDGSDVTTPNQWVPTDNYKDFVEKIMVAEEMRDLELETPVTATAGALAVHTIGDIEDMTRDLSYATRDFKGLIQDSTAGELKDDNDELKVLITTAKQLFAKGEFSAYDGFDLLTATTTVTKLDGTTQGNYNTYEVTTNSPSVVTQADSDNLFEAIMDAIIYDKTDDAEKDLESTEEATDALQTAMNEFDTAKVTPSSLKFDLFKLIYGDGDGGYAEFLRELKTSEVQGQDVTTTDYWSTNAEKTAFNNEVVKSIGTLENKTVKAATVGVTTKTLMTARTKVTTKPGTGTFITFKNDLSKKINEAKYWVFDEDYVEGLNRVETTPDPGTVTTRVYISDDFGRTLREPGGTTSKGATTDGDLWVSEDKMVSFKKQIDTAKAAWNNNKPSEATLKTARTNLEKQMDTFLNVTAQKAVSTTDFRDLLDNFGNLISTTKTTLYSEDDGFVWGQYEENDTIKISAFGDDVTTSDKWATKADFDTLNKALKVAHDIYEKRDNYTYGSIKKAYETFKLATEAFDAKLQPGIEGEERKPLWNDIVDARTTIEMVLRSEVNGDDIPDDEDWVNSRDYDAFKNAINSAEATIKKSTVDGTTDGALVAGFKQSVFSSAQKTLKAATDKFVAAMENKKPGTGLLAPKKADYLESINMVNTLIGELNFKDTNGTVITTTTMTDWDDKLTELGYDLTPTGSTAEPEGIRKSVANNGVEVESKYLWLPGATFDSITKTIDTNMINYKKPGLTVAGAESAIDTLEGKNLKTWIDAAKKSGTGKKEIVAAARTTLLELITTGCDLLGQTVTTADDYRLDISYIGGRNYRMSDMKGVDVPNDTAWSSSAHNRTFTMAIDKAILAYQNEKADQRALETAISTFDKSLKTFKGYTDDNGRVYPAQWFASGSSNSIGTSISALKVTVARVATTIPMLKVSALGTGADVSHDHILISGVKRTTSNLPILSEINAAYSKANTMSKARLGAYTLAEIQDAEKTLTDLLNTVTGSAINGNKEETLAAKTALKQEITAANTLVREANGKKHTDFDDSFAVRMLEEMIKDANAVYANRYASTSGTSYTQKADGTVELNDDDAGKEIAGKKYDIIGATTGAGIRETLYNAVQEVAKIQ